MLKVGLTGGIASGKSTVAALFESLGIPIIYADKISREVVAIGSKGLKSVQQHFGSTVLQQNGELDRTALREIVFSDPRKKALLESLLHPLIRARSDELEAQALASAAPYVIFEIPLLLETGRYQDMDIVIVVDVSEETQINRVLERDNCSRAQAEKILATQSNRVDRLAIADEVISNEGDVDQLESAVSELHIKLLKISANTDSATKD